MTVYDLALTKDQIRASNDFRHWWREGGTQVFHLHGYAGTGKTELARHLTESAGAHAQFLAYTGKAARVLQERGCDNARTIHSAIYYPITNDYGDVIQWAPRRPRPGGEDRTDGPWNYNLLVVDECSMVPDHLAKDLLSYGVRTLVIGDSFQLPPIGAKDSPFIVDKPDAMLREITRQAEGSPIIRLSRDVREGRRIRFGDHGDGVRVLYHDELTPDIVLGADQIICGRHVTRCKINAKLRALLGRDSASLLSIGDRLICQRNGGELLNGDQFVVERIKCKPCSGRVGLVLRRLVAESDCDDVVEVNTAFSAIEPSGQCVEKARFVHAHGITLHKGQGSQWDDVVLMNEASAFDRDVPNGGARWLYTGLTRARRRLTVVSLETRAEFAVATAA